MSVRSVKTAVIWAKPLREKERVDSRPGVPASAVSTGNVTCFSISIGASAGAMALICTCTLVTSGTASIGSFVKDQAPDTAAARVARTTSQRWRTEKARIRSSNRSVLGQGLHQLSLERKRIRHGNHFAGSQPRHDLHETVVIPPQAHWVPFEAFRRTDENHLFIINRLNGACRNDERDLLLFDHDCRSDERPRPPNTITVGDLGYDMRGTRLLVEERADKDNLAVEAIPRVLREERRFPSAQGRAPAASGARCRASFGFARPGCETSETAVHSRRVCPTAFCPARTDLVAIHRSV